MTCLIHPKGHSDAAKKLSDTYNLHRIAIDTFGIANLGRWFACALADGETDGVLYDSKIDAVRHQGHNEDFYVYVKISPSTMTQCDAEIYLGVWRRAYDAGLRLTERDSSNGGRELIKRNSREDQYALVRGIAQNLIIPERW